MPETTFVSTDARDHGKKTRVKNKFKNIMFWPFKKKHQYYLVSYMYTGVLGNSFGFGNHFFSVKPGYHLDIKEAERRIKENGSVDIKQACIISINRIEKEQYVGP